MALKMQPWWYAGTRKTPPLSCESGTPLYLGKKATLQGNIFVSAAGVRQASVFNASSKINGLHHYTQQISEQFYPICPLVKIADKYPNRYKPMGRKWKPHHQIFLIHFVLI